MNEAISIQFNGQAMEVPVGTNVSQLLEQAEIRSRLVAVEVNQEIVPFEEHGNRCVNEGDVIEAVTLVGGG